MARDEVQAVIERFVEEIWNQGNLDAVGGLLSPEVVYYEPMQTIRGIEPYRQFVETFRTTFPSARITWEDLVIEGDRAAFRWALQAAHEGNSPALPIPPTGLKINMSGQTAFRLEEGKIAEIWMETDYSPLFRMAFAFVAALIGAIVGLFMLVGIISKLIRGDSGK
jgi:predicted ester cyclase